MAGTNRPQTRGMTDQQSNENSQEKTQDDETTDGSVNKNDIVEHPLVLTPKRKTVAKPTFKSPTRSEAKTVVVVKVSPTQITGTALNGIVIVGTGFMMDVFMTSKLYLKWTEKGKQTFIEDTNAVPWVITKVLDKDGHVMKKRKGGWSRGDPLPYKAIAILTTDVLKNDEIKNLINETINPATWNNYLDNKKYVEKKYGEEKNLPIINGDPNEYITEVETWDQALADPAEVLKIVESKGESVETWLSEDKNNLYQLFREGYVPIHHYKHLTCGPRLLRAQDMSNYNKYITKQDT